MLASVIALVKDCLFPIFCLGCDKEGEWLCVNCRPKVAIDGVFDAPLDAAMARMSAAARYGAGALTARVLHAWKYQYAVDLAPVVVSFLDAFFSVYHRLFLDIDAIVSVPLHSRRFAERGFNQADVIAACVAARLDRPVISALRRRRYTRRQARLPKDERRENVRGAFAPRRSVGAQVRGLHILLVDDVYTTGSTMHECARILLAAGAKSVDGFAFARG